MSEESRSLEVEATGETVGEAKWQAVRELERLHPGVDRDAIQFQVVSEGERGLLGVGTTPAVVIARAEVGESAAEPRRDSELAELVRESVDRVAAALCSSPRVTVTEDDALVCATVSAPAAEVGYLIGRSGRTIDAVQYVVSAIAHRAQGDGGKEVDVDAGGYRTRRRQRLSAAAASAAARALATGEPVTLAPMTSLERKIVHTELQDTSGVETRSEGDEPNRCVVVVPTLSPGAD